jgi:hypothetical protein
MRTVTRVWLMASLIGAIVPTGIAPLTPQDLANGIDDLCPHVIRDVRAS